MFSLVRTVHRALRRYESVRQATFAGPSTGDRRRRVLRRRVPACGAGLLTRWLDRRWRRLLLARGWGSQQKWGVTAGGGSLRLYGSTGKSQTDARHPSAVSRTVRRPPRPAPRRLRPRKRLNGNAGLLPESAAAACARAPPANTDSGRSRMCQRVGCAAADRDCLHEQNVPFGRGARDAGGAA